MDDYSVASLVESKNEWCARLVNIMTYAVIAGLKSIFEEAWSLCIENDEEDKYLMTFQTFLSRVPKWNNTIIEAERTRILEVSSCAYLEDLITCVHIIQLKALTCIRVGQEQKKVNIDIPSVDKFIHKVYINVARKVYTNVYLFEKNIQPLDMQKHNRELEIIIKEAILNTVRDSMPVEDILKSYINETTEEEVDIKEEVIATIQSPVIDAESHITDCLPVIENQTCPETKDEPIVPILETPTAIMFSDEDQSIDVSGLRNTIIAPKTDERLEKISQETSARRKLEEQNDEDDDFSVLKIGDELPLSSLGINEISSKRPIILDIENIS
jgi:hypothetical protein